MRSAVVLANELLDPGDKGFHAPESPASNSLLGDDVEPDFHLIQPGGVGGCVVNLETGMGSQPSFNFGMLVGGVVVDHQMDV